MINRKIDIFEAEEIKAVIDFMKTEKDIIDIVEVNGISTITTNSMILLYEVSSIYLRAGQIITINKINYKVLSVDLKLKKFTIEAVGLYHMSNDIIPIKVLDATKWNLAINFKVGSRMEINELLTIETTSNDTKLQRFPLVWLFINEGESTNGIEFDHSANIKMAFVNLNTKLNDRVLTRIDLNFETVIQPLLTLFEVTIRSAYFTRVFNWEFTEYKKTKYNRFFYGSSDKNEMVLTSPTDAIEVEFDLTFQNQY